MRQFLHILFLTLAVSSLHAQSDETSRILSYIQKAMNFNKVMPQEKVYLHFDNMGYFENETLWFKAYVTRTDTGHPTDLSKVLYVELLNPTGDVLQTSKYPIDSLGQSHGEMKLDTILGSGLYEVRAYTRYMTNWGTNAVFSRVIPIFKAPKTEGDYSDLTIATIPYHNRLPNRRDPLDSLYVRAVGEGIYTDDLMKTVSVKFYPEGGDLIAGKKCRVAMLAVDDNGHPYEGEGFVMNERGDVLASVKTDTLGRGLFELVPDTGKLTFQIRNLKKLNRKNLPTRNGVQFIPLPVAKEEGCALHVDAVSEQMLATLQCTDGICGSMLGYVLMHNGNIHRCDTLTASPLIEIELDRQAMPEGVNQMTVFDSRGAIMAERLFFICPKPDKSDSIQVTAITKRLKPCGKVELELQTKPNANLSFSAMDAKTMTNGKQGNMKTWMLLSSEVRGYIHNVDYYFEADDKEHRQNADLLMLTQGWRRYDWRLMSEKYTFRKAQPIEDQFYLNGQLKVYRKHNPVSNVRMYVSLYNEKGQSLIGNAVTDSLGNYAFKMPFLDGEWKMNIYTTRNMKKGEKKKTYYVGIDRQYSPVPRYLTPIETEIQHPLLPNAFVKKMGEELEEEDEFIPITEKDHVLQNVTVKAKRKYFTNDNWRYKNEAYGKQYASLYYNADRELDKILDRGEPVPYINDFILQKLKDRLGKYNYTPRDIKAFTLERTFYVIDNNDRSVSFPVYLDEVKSIYIVFNERISPTIKNAWTFIDTPKLNIIVYLYCHHLFSTESNKGLRRTYFQGFNQASTFKTEDYSVIPPMADFRRTIWWQPDITTDAEGKAKVEFFNNSTCEEMYISVEGMTPDGKVLINE